MKNIKLLGFAVILSSAITGINAGAVTSTIAKAILGDMPRYSAETICKSGVGGVGLLRPMAGRACRDRFVAAFAEVVCPALDKTYLGSSCHTEAVKTLAGADAKTVLEGEIKDLGDQKEVVCKFLSPKPPACAR